MESILNELEKFNFSRTEAQVYVTLVQHNQLNGSQIAKLLNTSRSTVYASLNNLQHRGVIYLLPGESNLYRAENPEVLIEKLKTDYMNSADTLKKNLSILNKPDQEEWYMNIKGTDNFISKTKEILLTAQKEIYMNTCIDLQVFKNEFIELNKRGVRIIIFTFDKLDTTDLHVEMYYHPIESDCCEENNTMRVMLVVDRQTTLIGGRHGNEEVIGTFTKNPLLASIVAEHIHHDIYLLRLKEKYHKEIIDETILIGSMLERREDAVESLKYKGGKE